MAGARKGVFQMEDKRWNWVDPSTGEEGPGYDSRDGARTAYAAVRKATPVPESTAESAAPVAEKSEKVASRRTTAKKKAAKKTVAKKSGSPRKAASGDGPVAEAWAIFDKGGKSATRKELLDKCEAAGINPNTARTQYQRWLHREDGK